MTPFAFVMGPMFYVGAIFGPGVQQSSTFTLREHAQAVQIELGSPVRAPSMVAGPLRQMQIQYRPVTMHALRK